MTMKDNKETPRPIIAGLRDLRLGILPAPLSIKTELSVAQGKPVFVILGQLPGSTSSVGQRNIAEDGERPIALMQRALQDFDKEFPGAEILSAEFFHERLISINTDEQIALAEQTIAVL